MATRARKTKAERIAEIQAAATDVFLAKGFRNATMEDIVAATSLSKGGVYHYYQSTKDLLLDMMERETESELARHIAPLKTPSKSPLTHDVIRTIVERFVRPKREKDLFVMFMAEIPYSDEFLECFLRLERHALHIIDDAFAPRLGRSLREQEIERLRMVSRMMQAMIFYNLVFRDHSFIQANAPYLENMFQAVFAEILGSDEDSHRKTSSACTQG